MMKFDIEDRLIEFAVRIMKVVEALPNTVVGTHISKQLIRSGTSPAANYGEAQSAESRKDFIHKMKIALKELRESHVWLKMIARGEICPPAQLDNIASECNELISIFVKSIQTARNNEQLKTTQRPR